MTEEVPVAIDGVGASAYANYGSFEKAYRDTSPELSALKAKYDPDNVLLSFPK